MKTVPPRQKRLDHALKVPPETLARELLRKNQLLLFVSQITQIDVPDELYQMLIELKVSVAWDYPVEALLPKLMLDQSPDYVVLQVLLRSHC